MRQFSFEDVVSCVLAKPFNDELPQRGGALRRREDSRASLMSNPRVMSFTGRSTSRVQKFSVAACTCALINAVGFLINYACSMSWVRGRER